MKSMKKEFQVVTRGLKALARKTEQMVKKVDRLQKAKAAPKRTVKAKTKTTKRVLRKKAAKKAPAKRTHLKKKAAKKAPAKRIHLKKKAAKKAPARRKAVVRKARTIGPSATAQILTIMKRFKKGVRVPVLMKKTRFNDKKVRDILSNAFAQRKVRRIGRGVYVAA
jgi:hypothetical protein